MYHIIQTKNQSFTINLELITQRPERLRIVTIDINKPNTSYSDRYINISGKRDIEIKVPLSPKTMALVVLNTRTGINPKQNDNSFVAKITSFKKLKTYQLWLKPETKSFINFAKEFCENAGIIPIGVYESNDKKYTIHYLNIITDRKTGKVMFTPSQIGNKSGLIRVSREHFISYTVPQRYIILLHEFAHKYINPKKGKRIDDELAADKNALYIYLGDGFPRIDARTVYLKVFINSNNEENLLRYTEIDNFIKKYDEGHIAYAN